jgi:hypothetical protein
VICCTVFKAFSIDVLIFFSSLYAGKNIEMEGEFFMKGEFV